MAISGITTNYTGRTMDISIMQKPDATLIDAQNVAILIGSTGRFCSGIQKLVQRYMILLMTAVGSQEDFPDDGTDFLPKLQNGIGVVDRLAATQTFELASYAVVNQLKEYQSKLFDQPQDEKIVSATLQNITMHGGRVSLDIRITTEAGNSAVFLIPLPN